MWVLKVVGPIEARHWKEKAGIKDLKRNTIKHEVDQAMKEANELVAGDVGGGDMVGGEAERKANAERRDACGTRGVGATQARNPSGADNAGARHGRNVLQKFQKKKNKLHRT